MKEIGEERAVALGPGNGNSFWMGDGGRMQAGILSLTGRSRKAAMSQSTWGEEELWRDPSLFGIEQSACMGQREQPTGPANNKAKMRSLGSVLLEMITRVFEQDICAQWKSRPRSQLRMVLEGSQTWKVGAGLSQCTGDLKSEGEKKEL